MKHLVLILCFLSTHITHVCAHMCEDLADLPPLVASPCHRFFGQVDSLYYKAGNELTPYIEHSIPETSHTCQRVKHLEYDSNAGFRATIGYHLPHDCWKLYASWLHYDNHTSVQKEVSWNQGLGSYINMPYGLFPIKILLETFEPTTLSRGHAKAQLSMNEFSLGTSREFSVGKCVTLTPNASLKAHVITSRYTQQYQVLSRRDLVEVESLFQSKTEYKAIGVSSGIDSSWLIGCGLSLYAQGAATLYYSHVDLVEAQQIVKVYTERSSKQFDTLTYQLDYGLGFRWSMPFDGPQRLFCIHLGWEGKYLPEMNRIAQEEQTSRAPLILHGMSFGASLTY